MVYLQDSEHRSRLYALDGRGIHRLPAIKSRIVRRAATRRVAGHLGRIADKPAALYVAGRKLWFAIDDQPWLLDELEARVDESEARVEICTPDHRYGADFDPTSRAADTPFAEPEDWSFGVWVAHIAQDPTRQRVLLDSLYDAPLTAVPEHAPSEGDQLTPWKSPRSGAPSEHRFGSNRAPEV